MKVEAVSSVIYPLYDYLYKRIYTRDENNATRVEEQRFPSYELYDKYGKVRTVEDVKPTIDIKV